VIRVAGILIALHASDQKARAELMRELRIEFGLVERNEAQAPVESDLRGQGGRPDIPTILIVGLMIPSPARPKGRRADDPLARSWSGP
jgi:hypothetical protein